MLNRRTRTVESSGTSSQTVPVDQDLKPRDVLYSGTRRYQLQYFTFNGCFSDIAKCKDMKTNENVAIKILRGRACDSQETSKELAILKRINNLDPENIVRFLEDFEHNGKTCLGFEMLDKNLNELLRVRRGEPLSLQEIRPITQQLLNALESLKSVGIIHANIKPHNIMLVNHKDQPFRVKLIDFSLAVPAAEVKHGVTMQPVSYRSPDVILGLPITEAVDMWSLGGVLATLYLCSLPFPQRSQYHLIKTMVETLGQPEDKLLSDGIHTLLYFSPNQDSEKPAWRLKTADEYKAATGSPAINFSRRSTVFNCLSDLIMLHPEENMQDKMKFVHLLRKMLHMNPQRRITPSEALVHPFTTLSKPVDHKDSNVNHTAVPMSVSPVVETAETTNASSHTDEEPVEEGDPAAVDTADRASAIMSSTDEASAAIAETSNKDSAADFSGENLPAVCLINEASDGAAVSDDVCTAKSNDDSVAPVVSGLNDAIPADTESTAELAEDTVPADEALSESVRAESYDAGSRAEDSASCSSTTESSPNLQLKSRESDDCHLCDQVTDAGVGFADEDEAASTPASTEASPTDVATVLCEAISADTDTVTAASSDEASTALSMTETIEAEVSSPTYEALSPPLNAVNTNSCDGVSDSESENTWTLKRIRKMLIRMFIACCCCCCTSVDAEQ